jgi:hypothetical protein
MLPNHLTENRTQKLVPLTQPEETVSNVCHLPFPQQQQLLTFRP